MKQKRLSLPAYVENIIIMLAAGLGIWFVSPLCALLVLLVVVRENER